MKHSIAFLLLAVGAFAATVTLKPTDNWQAQIANPAAGTTFIFTTGTYTPSGRLTVKLQGTPSAPIVLKGDGSRPKIQRPDTSQNIMDLTGNNFVIQGMEFIGGSRGIRVGDGGTVSNAAFIDLKIHDTDDTAFSCNDDGLTYTNITIQDNEVFNTGTGTSECFYLGCNNDGCQFSESLILHNLCYNTQNAISGFGAGIQIKSGSFNNRVFHNTIHDVGGVGIFVYDGYDRGVNVVNGNAIWNSNDNSIQCTSNAIITNNLVVGGICGIAGIPNQLKPGSSMRDLTIAYNTIADASDACLRGNNWGAAGVTPIKVMNNVAFCPSANNAVTALGSFTAGQVVFQNNHYSGNLNTGQTAGWTQISGAITTQFVAPDTTNRNYYPKPNSQLVRAGTDIKSITDVDYNCNARGATPSVGMYEFSTATNPGGAISASFKTQCAGVAVPPITTGGQASSAANLAFNAALILAIVALVI